MIQELRPALRMMIVLTIATGIVYPLAVTGICRIAFSHQADGSLLERKGHVVGSALIGQPFTSAKYFQSRPSAAGKGYDATASGGSNLGPTNKALVDRVEKSIAEFRQANPTFDGPIPADLLTASGSGLDPDISPAAALAQSQRIADARRAPIAQVQQLIASHTEGPQWKFLGEPRVNVLLLNLALDETFGTETR